MSVATRGSTAPFRTCGQRPPLNEMNQLRFRPCHRGPRRPLAPASGSLGVVERVRRSLGDLSRAERKVARALLSGPPTIGLESVSQLAVRAEVSGPTVSRFVARLGLRQLRRVPAGPARRPVGAGAVAGRGLPEPRRRLRAQQSQPSRHRARRCGHRHARPAQSPGLRAGRGAARRRAPPRRDDRRLDQPPPGRPADLAGPARSAPASTTCRRWPPSAPRPWPTCRAATPWCSSTTAATSSTPTSSPGWPASAVAGWSCSPTPGSRRSRTSPTPSFPPRSTGRRRSRA